jgi:hypothetical protein
MNRDLSARIGHDIGDAMDMLVRRASERKQSTRDGERANNASPVNNGN